MNAGNNDIPLAEPGDIIAYSWGGEDANGRYQIDHLAFVVGASDTDAYYPTVVEWGQLNWDLPKGIKYEVDNPSVHVPPRGWTYSEVQGKYLQAEDGHQNMTAYLLHFNGGILISNY
jgi:hypothetical protein